MLEDKERNILREDAYRAIEDTLKSFNAILKGEEGEVAGREDGGREDAGREDGGREDGGREDGGREGGGREDPGRKDAGREDGEEGRGGDVPDIDRLLLIDSFLYIFAIRFVGPYSFYCKCYPLITKIVGALKNNVFNPAY